MQGRISTVLSVMFFVVSATQRILAWTTTTTTTTAATALAGRCSTSINKRGISGVCRRSAGLPTSATTCSSRCMTTYYGQGMDQHAMMESDRLIAVDERDNLIFPNAHVSKKQGHCFNEATPRGILHRAFSFFLFDDQNRMLLTQRASTKITFPNVWTNTCCSHPLHDMIPNEVDENGAFPHFEGIKHAARRKLLHELGIDPRYIPHSDIVFVKRFHYWAADTITYGKTTPWGEHEVDYILFFQQKQKQQAGSQISSSTSSTSILPTTTIPVHPNPDEVANYKYVTLQELRDMMETPGLLWSPWFRGIMDRGGWDWWEDLNGSLHGKYTSDDVIYFDPPREHRANYNLDGHGRQTGVLTTTTTTTSTTTTALSSTSSSSTSSGQR